MKIEKWSIYRADLDPIIGSEQGKSRPVIVISEDIINNLLNSVSVLPITTRKNGRLIYPNESLLIPTNINGISNESVVLCHQIRTLDKQRLSFQYGFIEEMMIRDEIIDALCFQLGIERYTS